MLAVLSLYLAFAATRCMISSSQAAVLYRDHFKVERQLAHPAAVGSMAVARADGLQGGSLLVCAGPTSLFRRIGKSHLLN
mmetsp:Transcript_24290/g.51753  ORF Transcript_24290/g.51753 Transcript_24290/m.51753 type:complete len:80 (+) Transcript_24290:257-496(+)